MPKPRQKGWLTAYCVGKTVWMRNGSIRDFRERLEQNGHTVLRICRGLKDEEEMTWIIHTT